jgi:hypothetical protein
MLPEPVRVGTGYDDMLERGIDALRVPPPLHTVNEKKE